MGLKPDSYEEAIRKQREWERRSKPLKRTSGLSRGGPIKPVRKDRKKRRHERDFGAKADMIRNQPCDACGAPPPSDPDHHPTRAAGGTSEDLWPLCADCHRDRHRRGIETFQFVNDVNADERTEHWERKWQERRAP